jgi:hypothetical protein
MFVELYCKSGTKFNKNINDNINSDNSGNNNTNNTNNYKYLVVK